MVKRARLIWMIGTAVLAVVLSLCTLLIVFLGKSGTVKTRTITILSDSAEQSYTGEPLIAEGYRIIDGELREGHSLVVKSTGTQTKIGESSNYFTAAVVDSNGQDVSSQYALECVFGKLKVVQIPITVITTGDAKLYDGEPLYSPQLFTVEPPDLAEEYRIEATFTEGLSVCEPNETKNDTAKVKIFNKLGADVTTFFDIEYDYGELKIEMLLIPPISLPGDDEEGLDLSGNIAENEEKRDENEDKLYYTLTSSEDDFVYLKILSYKDCINNQWTTAMPYQSLLEGKYSALYIPSYLLAEMGEPTSLIVTNHEDTAAIPYYITTWDGDKTVQKNDVASSGGGEYRVLYYKLEEPIEAILPEGVAEYEKKYAEYVKENYLLVDDETREYFLGVIEREGFSADDPEIISKVAYFISESMYYNKDYNKALDYEENIVIAALEEYKEGLCRHYASAATLLFRALGIPARYTVGFASETIAGAGVDVKGESFHAWTEVYIDGFGWRAVEVTQGFGEDLSDRIEIEIAPEDVEIKYDRFTSTSASAINKLNAESEQLLLEYGCTYEVEVEGFLDHPGKTDSVIKRIRIYRDGEDVTRQFHIKKETGIVRLYYAELGFISDSKSVEYGNTAVGEDSDVKQMDIYENLLDGHRFETVSRKIKNSTFNKAIQNTFDVYVYDENGVDITQCYKIRSEYGDLKVTAANLSIKVNDREIALEELPEDPNEKLVEFIIPDDFEIEGLVGEDYVESIEVSYVIENYGKTTLKIVSVKIVNETEDENGEIIINDVTENYILDCKNGVLKIMFA